MAEEEHAYAAAHPEDLISGEMATETAVKQPRAEAEYPE
jgi:hypothetical protein